MNGPPTHETSCESTEVAPTRSVLFDYSFCVWPSETWGFTRQTFDVFRMMVGRVDMTFTPEEFEMFRSAVNRDGLTLREISRIPHHEPEPVY